MIFMSQQRLDVVLAQSLGYDFVINLLAMWKKSMSRDTLNHGKVKA